MRIDSNPIMDVKYMKLQLYDERLSYEANMELCMVEKMYRLISGLMVEETER